jgi:hypothetical protein
VPDDGWKFVSWDNGSTNPGRIINITDNIEIT